MSGLHFFPHIILAISSPSVSLVVFLSLRFIQSWSWVWLQGRVVEILWSQRDGVNGFVGGERVIGWCKGVLSSLD